MKWYNFKDERHRGAATAKAFGWKSLEEITKAKGWRVAKKEPKGRNGNYFELKFWIDFILSIKTEYPIYYFQLLEAENQEGEEMEESPEWFVLSRGILSTEKKREDRKIRANRYLEKNTTQISKKHND